MSVLQNIMCYYIFSGNSTTSFMFLRFYVLFSGCLFTIWYNFESAITTQEIFRYANIYTRTVGWMIVLFIDSFVCLTSTTFYTSFYSSSSISCLRMLLQSNYLKALFFLGYHKCTGIHVHNTTILLFGLI